MSTCLFIFVSDGLAASPIHFRNLTFSLVLMSLNRTFVLVTPFNNVRLAIESKNTNFKTVNFIDNGCDDPETKSGRKPRQGRSFW